MDWVCNSYTLKITFLCFVDAYKILATSHFGTPSFHPRYWSHVLFQQASGNHLTGVAIGQYKPLHQHLQWDANCTVKGRELGIPYPFHSGPFWRWSMYQCINDEMLHLNTTGTIQFDDQRLTEIRTGALLKQNSQTCQFFIHREQQSQVMVKCLVQLQYILVNTWTMIGCLGFKMPM